MSEPRGPIFVAGLERSGTSLIYALLASHPNIAMTRRTNLWTHFYGQYGDLADPANLERCLAMFERYKRTRKLHPDLPRLRREFAGGEPTYGRLFALLEMHYAEREGKSRWGDKSLNTEKYAAEILASYPGVRILHMVRDPRDRYASSLVRWKSRRGGVGAGTAEWLASVNLAQQFEDADQGQYRTVTYEELVTRPEEVVRSICKFINEEYTPEMMAMGGAPSLTEKGFNSSYGPMNEVKISTGSIGRYVDVLKPTEIEFIQEVAEAEMGRYGYSLPEVGLSRTGRLTYTAWRKPLEHARMAAWRTSEAIRDRRGRPVPKYRLVDSGTRT